MPIDIENDSLDIAIEKLKAKEESLTQLEAISNFGSWEVDLKTNKSIWSDQSYMIYGLDKSVEPTLELFLSYIIPQDLTKVQKAIQEGMVSGEVTSIKCKIKRDDGDVISILLYGKAIYEDKIPVKLIGTTQNITELVSLKKHTDELSELIEHSSNEIYILDYITLKYLYVNQGACNASGYTKEELLDKTVYDLNPYLTLKHIADLKHKYNTEGGFLNRSIHKRKDGSEYHVQAYIHTLDYNGTEAFVLFDTDISIQVEHELLLKKQSQLLNHQANHDSLTNLPNRMLFQDRISQSIKEAKRNNEQFALLFIDLDQFKKINDSLGHHVGDKVLIEAAIRLNALLREGDTLARLGGDEFTIILKNINSIQDASSVAQKIIDTMKEPIEISEKKLYISSSIGISMFPVDSLKDEDLIKFADVAMYKAKDEGRDNFQFYSPDMTAKAFERVLIDSNLRNAIKEDQFVVYYQPQYDATDDTVIGMEALVRWNHPTLGLVFPQKFIPIAQESYLIIEIDKIVMQKAMKQFVQWYDDGLNPGILSLNLSIKQLNSDDFLDRLLNTMHSLNFKASWLELEVTEGQVMNNPDSAIQKLEEISNLGISLAIDDFGTGYSSLAYLKKLPLNKLKIDQSFIRDIPHDEDDKAITKAIIALGKSLNLKLIAEGVEIEDQKDFLLKHGCVNIQGFLYSKAVPHKDITKILTT